MRPTPGKWHPRTILWFDPFFRRAAERASETPDSRARREGRRSSAGPRRDQVLPDAKVGAGAEVFKSFYWSRRQHQNGTNGKHAQKSGEQKNARYANGVGQNGGDDKRKRKANAD